MLPSFRPPLSRLHPTSWAGTPVPTLQRPLHVALSRSGCRVRWLCIASWIYPGDLVTGPDHTTSRSVPEVNLDAATTARIRAEEVERLRVRVELEKERRQKTSRSENRGCLGALNLVLKIMGW